MLAHDPPENHDGLQALHDRAQRRKGGEVPVLSTVAARSVGSVVNAPEVFGREDFRAWLNDSSRTAATWHKPGLEPGDHPDVFVLVDGGYEGDSSDMPHDIWTAICDAVYAAFRDGRPSLAGRRETHAVVRLTDLAVRPKMATARGETGANFRDRIAAVPEHTSSEVRAALASKS